ncbi:transposon ty3-i gag-pol polyprotein [Lasius niger]|uniref:Transposon ty3-i gag-pol polyprotein n=1 Tax=Lasius niger TaxID=67767 RepID=A0A0J7KJL2_LASNI|nr:transposon ty3-i gag-pol polyprotein [Lasius niger]
MTGLRSKQVYHEDHCRSSNSVLNQNLFKLPDIRHNEKIQYKGILESYRADQRSKKATNSGDTETIYLDDFLLVHQDQSKLLSQAPEAVNILESLGWQVNYQKSVLRPTQQIEYLGITWNTNNNTMFLSRKKLEKILKSVDFILAKQSCNLKQIQRLLGQLNFANFVIPRGRLHCQHLQIFSHRFNHRRPKERRIVPSRAIADLKWWRGAIWSTTSIHPGPYTHFLTTDAADTGWGAQLDEIPMMGAWTRRQRKWHSNRKEPFAVYAAIQRQATQLKGAHVLVQSDNRTLVAYIHNEGGTRSLSFLDLTCKLLTLTDRLNSVCQRITSRGGTTALPITSHEAGVCQSGTCCSWQQNSYSTDGALQTSTFSHPQRQLWSRIMSY